MMNSRYDLVYQEVETEISLSDDATTKGPVGDADDDVAEYGERGDGGCRRPAAAAAAAPRGGGLAPPADPAPPRPRARAARRAAAGEPG